MAFGRRQLAVLLLLLLFLAVASTAVPISRSLKSTVKNQVLFGNFQDVEEIEKEVSDDERRMNMQLTDYPGTGANPNHDPRPPGRGK